MQVYEDFLAKHLRPVQTLTPTKGSYVKHDEFEKAACAGSPMFAELKANWKTSSEWDCNETRSFNYAVCRASKRAP